MSKVDKKLRLDDGRKYAIQKELKGKGVRKKDVNPQYQAIFDAIQTFANKKIADHNEKGNENSLWTVDHDDEKENAGSGILQRGRKTHVHEAAGQHVQHEVSDEHTDNQVAVPLKRKTYINTEQTVEDNVRA